MAAKILTLGINQEDLQHLASDNDNILYKAHNLSELKSTLDRVDEIDTILIDSHYSNSIRLELRAILGLTPLTNQIVLQYYKDDELDLEVLRQLGIELSQAPLSSSGWYKTPD
jgi:hypothetical protein